MTPPPDRLVAALGNTYRLERELGQGGMATVYLAQDLKHDRKVAIKVLKPELAAVLGAERFVVEIKTTAAMQHPHILPLFDSGSADGFLYYVMPYIEGETLRDKLSRETQLGVDEAVRLAREVLDALQYAHEHGIVHRDVKPENILLHGGHALVADFGIALAVSAAAGGRMTETGLSLGTPHYMSPEQATAEKEITPRSDVYSLASVLYEMLAGEPPHSGGSAQAIIMKIIAEPVQPVTALRKSVPPHVAGALAKALEKVPADRFESAKAFSEALANPAYTNAAFVGATAGLWSPGRRGVPMRSFASISALAAVAIVAALWGWLRPAIPPAVSRSRTVLWDTPQIAQARVGRGVAISPDGGTIVFLDSTAAGWHLMAKQRDRLDAVVLTGTEGEVGAPSFSPDGEWLVFITGDGQVKKVPRSGGVSVVVADSASRLIASLAWLEDGTILFVDAQFGVRAVSKDGGPARQLVKGLSAADARRVLVNVEPEDSSSRAIDRVAGLPGGGAALFTSCNFGCKTLELRILDLRSNTASVVAPDVVAGWPLPGGAVAFVRKDGSVLAAPFDLSALRFKQPPIPVLDSVRMSVGTADMVVAANGTLLYVIAGSAATKVERYQPMWVTRTGVTTPIDSGWTVRLHGGCCTFDGGFALSPDGRRLALNAWRKEDSGDILVKQLDRAPFTLTPLTFTADQWSPVWTADGQAVVYALGTGVNVNERGTPLVRRRADGTGTLDTLLPPVHGREIYEVVPTRDSAQFILVVKSVGGRRSILLGRRGDTITVPLAADSAFDEVFPALSPDGRWLAYASNESGRFEVYVRPFPNVNAQRVQVSQAGGTEPRWAHSGRELFFRNGRGALVAAAVVPAATFALGAQRVLFEGRELYSIPREGARSYDVAPGDQRFAFMRPIWPTGAAGPPPMDKLVLVTNWGAEVQAKLAGQTPK